MELRTSDIPAGFIPEEPVNRALELKTALGVPFRFGPLQVPPLSIATAALLEVGGVEVFRSQDIRDSFGVAKMLYVLVNREKANELIFDWREWMESDDGIEFDLTDKKTWHKLDHKVCKFANKYKIWKKHYSLKSLLHLFEYVFVSFNGFLMLPENQSKGGKWWFDMPSLSSQILMAGNTMNLSYFDALWRFPVSMASHLTSQNMKQNGLKFVERPPSKPFLDEYRQVLYNREQKGKFHPWQLREPLKYEVSAMQMKINPKMGKKLAEMRDNFNAMSKKQLEKHNEKYNKIIEKELNAVKKKVGILDA
jgi:hypothetical protein